MGKHKDGEDLLKFLRKYPNRWHTYKIDQRTLAAVCYAIKTGANVELYRDQIKLHVRLEK